MTASNIGIQNLFVFFLNSLVFLTVLQNFESVFYHRNKKNVHNPKCIGNPTQVYFLTFMGKTNKIILNIVQSKHILNLFGNFRRNIF